ncbi:MAG: sulfur carrier protein ThiS [Acidobacteriota bacterium]|nr:sulfur carrier protein ThiS [Acidobacteriota bacterium]
MIAANVVCRTTGSHCSGVVVGIGKSKFSGVGVYPRNYNKARVCLSKENQVTINGERRTVPGGTTVFDVLRSLELDPERVAIELNRAIVKRDLWPSTPVDSGAEVEIVQFVGGG